MALKPGLALGPYAIDNARPGGLSSVEGVSDEMTRRVLAMMDAMPPELRARFRIISGFRDAARQAQVNPGVTNSRHMHGMALDLQSDPEVLDWINRNPQHGVGFPLRADPREVNHLEMIDPRGLRMPLAGLPNKPIAVGTPAPSPMPVADSDLTARPLQLATPAGEDPDLSGTAPAPVDPRLLAALMAQGGGLGGLLGGPSSLSDAITKAVKSNQTPAGQPEPLPRSPADPIYRRL